MAAPVLAADCRHCGKRITRHSVTVAWADGDGFAVCVKAPPESIAAGTAMRDAVFHEPMPAGLPGAPVQVEDPTP